VSGLAVWTALVLGCYIVGLSYIAKRETGKGPLSYWPCVFLAAPVLLALLENSGPGRGRSILLCTLLTFWIVRCLRFSMWAPQRNIGRTVAGLLAGIPLVDWLGVWQGEPLAALVFGSLFGLALLFQRFVPAT
jgi:4-hydroxybenzoate polyprenyltransferase